MRLAGGSYGKSQHAHKVSSGIMVGNFTRVGDRYGVSWLSFALKNELLTQRWKCAGRDLLVEPTGVGTCGTRQHTSAHIPTCV